MVLGKHMLLEGYKLLFSAWRRVVLRRALSLFRPKSAPYHIAQISILAASIPMLYYLARSLSSSRSVAFLAVLAFCYHVNLISLVFVDSFSYDVLCGFFYFAALTYYIHFRERDAQVRPFQLIAFLALYICALNFKEMAVTLPVIVLIYEVLRSPRSGDWRQFIGWARSSATPALIAGLITSLYIYGRIQGPTSLAAVAPYPATLFLE